MFIMLHWSDVLVKSLMYIHHCVIQSALIACILLVFQETLSNSNVLLIPYVVEFHFTKHAKYWLRRVTPSTSNLFIGGIMYYTCNKLLSVFVTKSQKCILHSK